MIADEILSPDLEPGIDMMGIHTSIRRCIAPPDHWERYNNDLVNEKAWATAIWPLRSGQVHLTARWARSEETRLNSSHT